MVLVTRHPEHPIDPLFIARWSPRAYDASAMPADDLLTMLEAARWAPSAYNLQPWRFLYSLRGDSHWLNYLSLLDNFNLAWARRASALVMVVSDSLMPALEGDPQRQSHSHSFDAGAAWAQLALQATLLGYHTHAMAGLDFAKAQQVLCVPSCYRIEVAIAVGKIADASILPATLRTREQPSQRRPMREIAFAGVFPP